MIDSETAVDTLQRRKRWLARFPGPWRARVLWRAPRTDPEQVTSAPCCGAGHKTASLAYRCADTEWRIKRGREHDTLGELIIWSPAVDRGDREERKR